MAAQACSLVDILNFKLKKRGYQTYEVGVGLDYGRALMIKAGNKGSGLNDVVWMGDVVNQACHLCNEANSGYFDKGYSSQMSFMTISMIITKNSVAKMGGGIFIKQA